MLGVLCIVCHYLFGSVCLKLHTCRGLITAWSDLSLGNCQGEVQGTHLTFVIQGDLSIKDTLGPAILSTVERLSTLQRWKMYYYIGKSTFGALERVLCREVISMVSFIGSVL